MTILFARVDGQPVSLTIFSLTSRFGRVNEQNVSLTNFYYTTSQRYLKASLTLSVSLTLNSIDFHDFEELLKVLM